MQGFALEPDTCEFAELCHQPILKARIERFGCRFPLLAVVPIAATDAGLSIVTDSKPGLGSMSECQIIRSAGAAHFGGHPPWIDCVAQDLRPMSGHRESKGGHIQLAF